MNETASDADRSTPSRSGPPGSDLAAADFGTRFSAFMIDALVLFAVQWIVVIVASRQLQSVGLSATGPCIDDASQLCEGPSSALSALLVMFLLATTVGYYAFFEARHGATPGKRLFGLRVVGADGAYPIGSTRGLQRSLARQAFWLSLFFVLDVSPLQVPLPPLLSVAIPVLAAGTVVYAAIAADGRGIHDRFGDTLVVRSADHRAAAVRTSPDPEAAA